MFNTESTSLEQVPFVTFKLTYRSFGRVRVVRDVFDSDGHGPDDVPRFLRFTGLADNRIETVNRIGGIVDGSHGTIGLHETILTADHVASSLFRLVFDVARGGVVHAVLVSVTRRHLQEKNIMYYRLVLVKRTRLYRFRNENIKLFSIGSYTQKCRWRVLSDTRKLRPTKGKNYKLCTVFFRFKVLCSKLRSIEILFL